MKKFKITTASVNRGTGKSRESLVSSRKFNKLASLETTGQSGLLKGLLTCRRDIIHPFSHNELTTNYSRLTTSHDNSARSAHNGRLTPHASLLTHCAFTMAEILLSLTIIGVVAAITLPSLTGNINERTWNTQRKALYSRMSQAISLMPALNGYGQTKAESEEGAGDAIDTAAETFITSGLAKVLKINNICDSEHMEDCGIPSKYIDIGGSTKITAKTLFTFNEWFHDNDGFAIFDTKAAAFETQNGESIIAYYNPHCKTEAIVARKNATGDDVSYPQAIMCVNFIYDLNGKKGPNSVGKDIGFITAFDSIDTVVVAPLPSSSRNHGPADFDEAISLCQDESEDSRMPNIDELSSLFINHNLINFQIDGSTTNLWSSSVVDSDHVWAISQNTRTKYISVKIGEGGRNVRCIKR